MHPLVPRSNFSGTMTGLFAQVPRSMEFSEVTSHLCTLRRSCNSQATPKTPHLGDAAGPPYRYAASLYNGAGRALLLLQQIAMTVRRASWKHEWIFAGPQREDC